MKLSTEAIFTKVFGVPATPVQRAACRARDGLPLGELADDPEVIEAFGGEEAIANLPGERGIKPSEYWNIASSRTGKTTLAVSGALADSQSVDLSGLGLGDVPRITILSVKLDVADVPYTKLRAAFDHPAFRPLLVSERPSDRMLTIRHPSGKSIEVCVAAGGQAGVGVANRWSAGIIADEVCKMNARADDRVTNLDDVLSVGRERLLDDAQIDGIGSPWAPNGTAYDMVQTYFGSPGDIVLMRTTGPAGNPSYWTEKRLARLEAKDPVAWRINKLGEFIDQEAGLISPIAIDDCTRKTPLELPPVRGGICRAAVDTSEGSEKGNGQTLVIVRANRVRFKGESRARTMYRVVLAREWRGVRPDQFWQAVAECCGRYGLNRVVGDQYAGSANRDLAARYGLKLAILKTTAASNLDAFSNLATVIHEGAIELPPHKQLRADLLSIKKRASQGGGFTIVLPKVGGRHADYAPALASAVSSAAAAVKYSWGVGVTEAGPAPERPPAPDGLQWLLGSQRIDLGDVGDGKGLAPMSASEWKTGRFGR